MKKAAKSGRVPHRKPIKCIDMSASSVAQVGTSEKNRTELHGWYKASKYSDAKFWISPNVLASSDECVAEVLSAVKSFDADQNKKPSNDTIKL